MRCINNFIIVEYDETHNNVINGLVRPKDWVFEDSDQKEGVVTYDTNRNKKETNPQIATVIRTNDKCNLKEGDLIFTHYLQYDSGMPIELEGKMYKMIDFRQIFFRIKGESDYEMSPNTYLGQYVIKEAPKTASGIYTTSDENIKESLQIKITHVPQIGATLKVGDIALTSDSFNYDITVHGKEYVKITGDWIPAKLD